MHKKAMTILLLGGSVAALAAAKNGAPSAPAAVPMAAQSTAALVQSHDGPAATPAPAIAEAVSRWRALRQSDRLPFGSYSAFLMRYQGWPGEAALRRAAEQAIGDGARPGEVIAYFDAMPPLTTLGRARLALALHDGGRGGEAREAAREAWRGGALPAPVEDRLLGTFGGAFNAADHETRVGRLLDDGNLAAAQRVLPRIAGPARALYDARVAVQTKAPDAADRIAALGAAADADAGLLMDRANWLRATGQPSAARALLGRPRALAQRPRNVEKFYETLLTIARGAAADSQWSLAYAIASQVDDAYPAGTDVGAQDYGERDDYTSLAWLAGTSALHRLGRPADAVGMFERYAGGARSPQTRAKGLYWAGRAAAAAGEAARADGFLAAAAAFPDQFYGQLALERLGRPLPAPDAMPTVDAGARAAFDRNELVAAIRLLGQTGERADQAVFVRALSDQLHSYDDRVLAGDLGQRIGRPDIGIWAARAARNDGATFYARAAFPEVPVPPAYAQQQILAHAVMRQESSFDRTAVSSAGARGMMQLMPGTARETAGKMGLPYDLARLTGDPQYNILLGNRYLSDVLASFGGNAALAAAAYNAGPGNVRRWLRENGDPRIPGTDIVRWIEDIPFSETRNYVQRVLENAVVYDRMANGPGRNRLSDYLGKRQPG